MHALRLTALLALALQASGGRAGTSPAVPLGSRRAVRAETSGAAACPPGHHAARSGRRQGCVQDVLATCPPGYARFQPRGSTALRCMSFLLRGTRHGCRGGEEPAVDARGMHRCALPDADRCRPGYTTQAVPGEGARCARWFE